MGIPPIPFITPPIYAKVLSRSLLNILIPVLLTWNITWTLILVNVFAIILVFLSRLQRFDFYWILFLQGFRASHFITCLYSIAPTVLFWGVIAKI